MHNGRDLVAEAIESVYAQTTPPAEVIVVDDGSTDDTTAVLEQFKGRPGFKSIRKAQGGPGSARNVGVENASGEFIAFLDHDDLWLPEKLERQLAHFDPSWGMSFTYVQYLTTTNSTSQYKNFRDWDPNPAAVLRRLERSSAVGPPSAVLVRRDALRRAGPFEDVSFGEDWLMWLRFVAAGNRVGYLPEPLTAYRWHGQNRSRDDHGEFFDCACAVFDRYGDRRYRAWWRLLNAIYAHEHHDRKRARRRILEAARIRPLSIRPGWIKLLI